MNALFQIGLTNALAATVLALAVFLLSKRWRNPAVIHALCLVVLLKFIAPPLLAVFVPNGLNSADEAASPAERADASLAISNPLPAPDALEVAPTVALAAVADASLAPEPTDYDADVAPDEIDVAHEHVDLSRSIVTPVDDVADAPVALAALEEVAPSDASPPAAVWWTQTRLTQATRVLQWLWAGGIVAFTLYVGRQFLVVSAILRSATAPATWLQDAAEDVAGRLGLRRRITLRVVDADMSPVVYCPLFRAVVLMPKRLLDEFSRPQVETILAHELAHLRRRDHRVRQFELLVTTLFWWCPVVWWVGRQLRRAEEACCDAEVLHAFPKAGRMYAHVLLRTVEMLRTSPAAVVPIGSTFGHVSELRRRIEQILDAHSATKCTWTARALVLGVACLLPLSFRAVGEEGETTYAAAEPERDAFEEEVDAVDDPLREEPTKKQETTPGDPKLAQVDAGQTPTPDVSPELLQLLKDWEAHSAKIKTLHTRFYRRVYDSTFMVEKQSAGELDFEVPNKGRITLRGFTPRNVSMSQRRDPVTQRLFALEADTSEQWICDGNSIWHVVESDKSVDELPLPKGWQGSIISDGPLPFLLGLPVEEALRRYEWKFGDKPSNRSVKEIWLNVQPRRVPDTFNWSSFKLVLDTDTYFPRFLKLVAPGGDLETVFQFQAPQINDEIAEGGKIYAPPNGPEWKNRRLKAPNENVALEKTKPPAAQDSRQGDTKTAAADTPGTASTGTGAEIDSPSHKDETNKPTEAAEKPEDPARGSLTGKFVYDGKVPERKQIKPGRDADAFGQTPIYDESLVVSKEGGLANVFVYVRDKDVPVDPLEGVGLPNARITANNGHFEPHAQVISTRQALELENAQSVSDNFHWQPVQGEPFNMVVSPRSQSTFSGSSRAESFPARFSSDLHPWMNGWLLVRANPYAVVTGEDGSFRIDNLPVGEWEFQFWHEKKGYLDTPDWPKGRVKIAIKPGANDMGTIKITPEMLEPKENVEDRKYHRNPRPNQSGLTSARNAKRWQTHRRNAPYGELGFVGEEYGPHWEFVRIATHEPAQKELKLSSEQIGELKPVFKSLMAKDGEWSQGRAKPSLLQLEFDITNRVLTDAQKLRVAQIIVQRHGLPVLLRTDMQKGLGITPEQATKIDAAWKDHLNRVEKDLPGNAGQESLFTAWGIALKALTDDQRDKLEKMTGRLVDITPGPELSEQARKPEGPETAVRAATSDEKENPWSEAVNGLQARLHFAAKRRLNDTVLIDTYLELRNVADKANVMEFPLNSGNFKFSVTDSAGKTVPQYNGPYDGSSVDPGLIRLPYEGVVKFNISMHGAGISRDSAAMLDLISGTAWTFPRDAKEMFSLEAEIKIAPEKEKPRDREPYWSGTIKIPKTRIPVSPIVMRTVPVQQQ